MKVRGFELISEKQFKEDFKGGLLDSVKREDIKLPKRATKKSAGYDFYTPINIVLVPGAEIKFPLGVKSYMKDNEVLKAFPRSGQGFKFFIRLANTVGIIDADYYNNEKNEGSIFVKLRNEGKETFIVNAGEAVGQFMFQEYLLADGDDYVNGEERKGGFGSSSIESETKVESAKQETPKPKSPEVKTPKKATTVEI